MYCRRQQPIVYWLNWNLFRPAVYREELQAKAKKATKQITL